MKQTPDQNPESLFWIRVIGISSALFGLLGLLFIFAQPGIAQEEELPPPGEDEPPVADVLDDAAAADDLGDDPADLPPPGENNRRSRPGSRTFGDNPFANVMRPAPGSRDTPVNERPRPNRNQPAAQPRQIQVTRPGAPSPNDSVPDPRFTGTGIEVGGGLPGGVKPGSELDPLRIDTETGRGNNAVITDFNFPDADILDIAKTLGKLTGKNFVYDKNVKGRITIISNSPITVGDAWKAFLTALDINGFTLIPSGNYIRIARQRDARDKQLKTYVGEYSPNSDALITRVFPLKYISAEEVARTFRSFMPANSRIIPYAQTNTVIVTDTGSNIAKLNKMLSFLDVEGFDAGIEIIGVQYASAVELAKLIDTLIPGAPSGGSKSRRNRGNRGSSFTARRTKEGGIINTIIADERTNTLIVHANRTGANQVRKLVATLDNKVPAKIGGGKIHVLYLQFADAEEVSKTLNALSTGASTRTRRRSSSSRRGRSSGSNPLQGGGLFQGQIKVSADKATNSLVITASPSDFEVVKRVVKKLDISRDQVYVEAVILEMTLSRDFEFSTNLVLPDQGIALTPNTDLVNFLANPVSQRGLIWGFASSQDAETEVNIGGTSVPVKTVQGLIKALQTHSKANVLATPQILTLDNTEAVFEAVENIPVPTSTSNQNAVTQSFTKEKVGLKIKLKPQINKASNFVKLEIETSLDDFSSRELPAAVAQNAIATQSRSTQTNVVVADQDTVVLGGLIRDKVSRTESKVPLLGDIPLLGWLFKSRRSEIQKTNLLVFITPHIIKQYDRTRMVLDKKLKERDDFIEDNAGGDDPLRKYRDNIIRSLPDTQELSSNSSGFDSEDGAEELAEEPIE